MASGKLISRKKKIYPIRPGFDQYLSSHGRSFRLPLEYDDLLQYEQALPLYDKSGEDSLWSTVCFSQAMREEIEKGLLQIYSLLRAEGDTRFMTHLVVDRVDLCLYGNTKPFRVRILNSLNDNFDYFYVKEADASRVYGLELEHILSPNRIGFVAFRNTLIEEHIYGVPGDMFIRDFLPRDDLNEVRLAKEFVKFNERCFLRLLGDMHSANFVIDITVDFEENIYRVRAIDFDQQSYEGRKQVYLPQFFKQNLPFVELVLRNLHRETIAQYQKEEQALIHKRMISSRFRLKQLLDVMKEDHIAPRSHVESLRDQLAEHHENSMFLTCQSMAELIETSLAILDREGEG